MKIGKVFNKIGKILTKLEKKCTKIFSSLSTKSVDHILLLLHSKGLVTELRYWLRHVSPNSSKLRIDQTKNIGPNTKKHLVTPAQREQGSNSIRPSNVGQNLGQIGRLSKLRRMSRHQ